MEGSCSNIIRYNVTENVWRYGRIRGSDESLRNHVSGGGMYVAKHTDVFWNFTKCMWLNILMCFGILQNVCG